jgi:hypothetical protein
MMFQSYLGNRSDLRGTRTLEIHQGKTGWFFTVHQGDLLLCRSEEGEDRSKVTARGIAYLDILNKRDHALKGGKDE